MPDFYDKLSEMNLTSILNLVKYSYPTYTQDGKVFDFLDDIIDNKRKVLIYGDYDPDGLMSALIVRDSFDLLKHKNYEMYHYREKTHSIDSLAVTKAIEDKFDYMIICDAGSSELNKLLKLTNFGIKCILLDHHRTVLSYKDFPDECAVINTTLENKILKREEFKLSAGALVFTVFNEYLEQQGIFTDYLAPYALTSLYADCIDMSKQLNRGIYYKACSVDEDKLPMYFKHFLNEYMSFNRRFIEFHFSPKINSLFRAERFDLINKYMFSNLESIEIAKVLEKILEVYENSRKMVGMAADVIEHRVLDNFVIGDLNSIEKTIPIIDNKMYNYTGLVANMLASRYNKAAVVYCDTGKNLKGSFRDLLSRDYLTLFKQFCNANGHSAAFGIHLNYFEFDEFTEYINRIDKKFFIRGVPNEPMVIRYDYANPDDVLLRDMAMYNEFAGNEIPIALLEKQLLGHMREYTTEYYYKYRWDKYFIQSTTRVPYGCLMKIRPTRGVNIKLVVADVDGWCESY